MTNLKQFRQFYTVYVNDQIGHTVSDQFTNLLAVSTGRKFFLSWSHYLKLMRIKNIDERHFYEIEAAKNDWSLSELKRQYDSSLYERLALSSDKEKVFKLAQKGHVVEMTLPEDNTQIFASKYETVLPSKAELQNLLNEQNGDM